jgi:hypothetical protein
MLDVLGVETAVVEKYVDLAAAIGIEDSGAVWNED